MKTVTVTTPYGSLKSITGGLVLMATFTAIWAFIAESTLKGIDFYLPGMLFGIFVFIFLFHVKKFKSISDKETQVEESTALSEWNKRWFIIVNALQGIGIFLAINIMVNLKLPNLIIPSIALVVGLHFFPLAKIFNRKIDYYTGAWTTLIAASAIYLITTNKIPAVYAIAYTAIGCATATSIYGWNMIITGKKIIHH